MNVQEVAKRLEISPDTVRSWAEKGLLPCAIVEHTHRRTFLFDRDAIERFILGENAQIEPKEPTEPILCL